MVGGVWGWSCAERCGEEVGGGQEETRSTKDVGEV